MPGGRVRLRIEVDQKHAPLAGGDGRAEVDGGGGLADSALLIRKCDDLRHSVLFHVERERCEVVRGAPRKRKDVAFGETADRWNVRIALKKCHATARSIHGASDGTHSSGFPTARDVTRENRSSGGNRVTARANLSP